MSFVLKSIEVKNIRVHEHFLFEPELEGITAISGENGTGKSTIVDSLAWVLFGTRVGGNKTSTLIRTGSDPRKEPVYAEVIIDVGGISYKVQRKIINEHGSVECNAWGKHEDSEDYVLLAGPGVTHVESFVRQTLKMDEKGFLASVLIQQKQVDQIVSASPRERGEVIEKLTGISSITASISSADEENRGLKKAVSLMQTGDLGEAQAKVDNQLTVVKDLKELEEETLVKFKDAKEKSTQLTAEYNKEAKKIEENNELNSAIAELTTENRVTQKQLDRELEYIEKHIEKYGSSIAMNVEEIKGQRALYANKISEVKSKMHSVNETIKSLEDNINAIDALTKAQVNKLNKELKENEVLIAELNENVANLKETRTYNLAEIKRAKNSLKQIDGEESHCPVCKGEITDPEHLIKEYEDEIAKLTKENKEIALNIKESEEKVGELLSANELHTESINSQEELIVLKKDLKEARGVFKSLQSELTDEETKYNTIEAQYNEALKVEADKAALDSSKENSIRLSNTIEINGEKIKEYKAQQETIKALGTRDFNRLRKEAQAAVKEMTDLSLKGKETISTRKLAQERLLDYEKNLQEVKETLERYNSLANQIEVLTNTSLLLNDFKRTRIEYSIPTLEFYASDILNKFTGGAFVKVSLDEKFNTTVTTAKGIERSTSQLSGGELSAVSIALRLGISLLLNANEKSVLIFDEVLVSMDEDRARHIMETVASLSNSQVIFIAHGSDISSVADKNVVIERRN